MFDEDFAVGVGDDDRVVVGSDEDLVEGVVHVDHVGDCVHTDGAGGSDSSDQDTVWQIGGWSRCRPRAWRGPVEQ